MTDVPHIGFILSAYGMTAVVLLGIVAAVILDGRAQRRLLAELERRRETGLNTGQDVRQR